MRFAREGAAVVVADIRRHKSEIVVSKLNRGEALLLL